MNELESITPNGNNNDELTNTSTNQADASDSFGNDCETMPETKLTSTSHEVTPTQVSKKTRQKKRTMAEGKTLADKIISLLEERHPAEAVALMCGVNESVVHKVIMNTYLKIGKEFPIARYSLLKAGKLIRDISALGITTDEYVKIVSGTNGEAILSPFHLEESSE